MMRLLIVVISVLLKENVVQLFYHNITRKMCMQNLQLDKISDGHNFKEKIIISNK